jgi:hypothetical protein
MGIPQAWCANVTHVLLLYLPHFLRPHLTEKSSTQDSSRFFLLGWLGCHSNRPGRSCLRTLQVPRVKSPLWHNNQVFPGWLDSVSTTSKALPSPGSSHSCCSFLEKRKKRKKGSLFSYRFPPLLVQGSNGMTFLSCSKELPIWNSHFGGQELFLAVCTKTPQGLCSSISQENSLYSAWGNFPPRTTSPIMWENVPLCDAKYSTLGTRGLCFQASVFLTPSRHTNKHTGYQEPQTDCKNSLHIDKKINSLWSAKYTGTHRV